MISSMQNGDKTINPSKAIIWTIPYFYKGPVPDFDHEKSKIESSDITDVDFLDKNGPPALLLAKKAKMASFEQLLCVPTTTSCPLVRGEAKALFEELSSDQVSFYPVEIHCKDGVIKDFWFVRPMIKRACTDFDNSIIDWAVEDLFYGHWDKLKYLDDCMEGVHILREMHTREVIVTMEFSERFREICPFQARFIYPEDLED